MYAHETLMRRSNGLQDVTTRRLALFCRAVPTQHDHVLLQRCLMALIPPGCPCDALCQPPSAAEPRITPTSRDLGPCCGPRPQGVGLQEHVAPPYTESSTSDYLQRRARAPMDARSRTKGVGGARPLVSSRLTILFRSKAYAMGTHCARTRSRHLVHDHLAGIPCGVPKQS